MICVPLDTLPIFRLQIFVVSITPSIIHMFCFLCCCFLLEIPFISSNNEFSTLSIFGWPFLFFFFRSTFVLWFWAFFSILKNLNTIFVVVDLIWFSIWFYVSCVQLYKQSRKAFRDSNEFEVRACISVWPLQY